MTTSVHLESPRAVRRAVAFTASTMLFAASFPVLVAQTVESLLPPDTIATIFVNDFEAYRQSSKSLPFSKIFAEPEVEKFLEKPKQALIDAAKSLEARIRQEKGFEDVAFDPEMMMSGAYGRMFVALTHFDFEMNDNEIPDIGLVLGFERRAGTPDWLALAKDSLTRFAAAEGAEDIHFETIEEQGVSFEILRDQQEAHRVPLCVADRNGVQLFSISKKSMIAVLSRMAKEAPSLASSKSWSIVRKPLGDSRPDSVQFYFDTPKFFSIVSHIADRVAQEAPEFESQGPMIQRLIDLSGFRDLGPFLMTSGAEDGVATSHMFTATMGPPKGLMKAFCPSQGGIDLSVLQTIPENTASVVIFHVDFSTIYDVAMSAMKEIDAEMHAEIVSNLESMGTEAAEGAKPISLRDDLFANLGPTFTMIAPKKPSMMQTIPPRVVVAEARNPDRLVSSLDQLLVFAGKTSGYPVKIDLDARKTYVIHQVTLPEPLSIFRPCFTVFEGKFYFATESGLLKQHLKRLEKKDAVNITSNPDFKRFASNLPESGITSLSYSDFRYDFESLYDMAVSMFPLAQSAIDFEIPIDMQLAPMRETISQHLFGSFSYSYDVPGGSVAVTHSPIGVEAMVAGIAGAAAVGGFAAATRIEQSGGKFDGEVTVSSNGGLQSKIETAYGEMQALSSHIIIYRLEAGATPSRLDDLKNAIPKYDQGVWSGPIPKDPWGTEYHYVADGAGWRIWSSGPNRVDDQGKEDDLVVTSSSK